VDRIGAWGAWLVAAVSLGAGAAARLAAQRRPLAAQLPVAAAIAAGVLIALPLGIVDFSGVLNAPWVGLPRVSLPRFAPDLVVASLAAGLVAAVEHAAEMLAAETVMGDDYIADRTLPRAALATGCAGLASALIGGPPLAVSSESLGLAALSGRREPPLVRWAAAVLILLAFLPKAGAALASLPRVVMGGVSLLMFATLCVRALRRLVSARVPLADPRVGLVTALVLVLGVGGAQLSLGPAGVSGAALALVAGVLLNLALLRDRAVKPSDLRP
jgi:uracil permease